MNWFIPLAIELGDFTTLSEQSSWGDFGWFFGGVAVLGGLTMLTLRWSNQSRRDPFEDFDDEFDEGKDENDGEDDPLV